MLYIGDTPLVWVQHRYMGVIIDDLLYAIISARQKSHSHLKYVAALTARGAGCDQTTELQVYQSAVLSGLMYALPILDVPSSLMSQLERDHRVALRIILGLSRDAQSVPLLAEAHQLPLRLQAEERALHHIERMYRAPDCNALINRLFQHESSHMGKMAALFTIITCSLADPTSFIVLRGATNASSPFIFPFPEHSKRRTSLFWHYLNGPSRICLKILTVIFKYSLTHLYTMTAKEALQLSFALLLTSDGCFLNCIHPLPRTAELAAIDVALN